MAAQIPTADEIRTIVREELRAALTDLPTGPAILTVEQAAALAGVSEKTLCSWIKRGRLKASKPGRRYQITRSDLDACLAAGTPRLVDEIAASLTSLR